ncbi:hypothetical protein CLIB1423_17S01200 [[Candida] railenensis]|uniref:Vacuolar protein sorting-associated protein 51 homolog n=1 Tax=[Candida] railenensis TaxID=45579 RepID=A0A9P0W016_9ASCO|nr:hypothetical protein CLIB1423_17S01200 [[Candida] railenensis]
MSDGVLSYKKPGSRAAEEAPHSTASQSSQSPTTLPAGGTLSAPANRKVSAGRKKLQEFYHLQAELKEKEEKEKEKQKQEGGTVASESLDPVTVTTENSLELLNSPEKLSSYLNSNSIHDILKLRNSIAHNLNSHDSEKKSIIYDNYYELIKLSEILGSLANHKSKSTTSSSNIGQFGQGINLHNKVVDGKNLEATFQELISFVDTDVSYFNSKFEDLVEKSIDVPSDDSSSIKTIIGGKDEEDVEINTSALEREINLLLASDVPVSQEEKASLVTNINVLLGELDGKNSLLSNQLKAVVARFSAVG